MRGRHRIGVTLLRCGRELRVIRDESGLVMGHCVWRCQNRLCDTTEVFGIKR